MTSHIDIQIIDGSAFVGSDDISRAEAAATAYFDKSGVDAMAAQNAYREQWEELDDETGMTGLALHFIAARSAADRALTEGWHSTDGASCTIEVWEI